MTKSDVSDETWAAIQAAVAEHGMTAKKVWSRSKTMLFIELHKVVLPTKGPEGVGSIFIHKGEVEVDLDGRYPDLEALLYRLVAPDD